MKTIATYFALCCFAAVPGIAQMNWTGYVGAGPVVPLNPFAGQSSGTGWNISAGGGVTTHRYGMMLDFMYDSVGINAAGLAQTGASSGNVHTWGFTLDPVVHITQEGPLDLYFTGGGGIYNRSFDFNNPMVSGPTSDSVYKGGVDGGVGVSFKLGPSHLKAFAEARYHYIFTAPTATTMIPVTVGLRW
jgi:hypothetical protein